MLCVGFHKMFNNKYKKVKKQPLAVRKWTARGCVAGVLLFWHFQLLPGVNGV